MIQLFQKIPVALPQPFDYKNKRQMLLKDIGGKWFMDKYKLKIPPMKKPIPSKEAQEKGDNIKNNKKAH